MDPLSAIGLAANVAGLVSLVIEVCRLSADYFRSINNMSSNMKVLREELNSLQHVLEQLSSLLHGSGVVGKFFQKSSVLYLTIASCTGDVQEMADKLRASKNFVARTAQKLHWPFEEKELCKFNDRLRKHISVYQFSLTMENCLLLSETSDKVTTILEIQKEHSVQLSEALKENSVMATFANQYSRTADHLTYILQILTYLPSSLAESQHISLGIEKLQISARNEREARILDWIPAEAPHKHGDISLRRVSGTGKWLIEHETYRNWQSVASSNKLLWCSGGPGTGKTFLASLVIDTLREQASVRNIGVAYFYCDYGVGSTQNFAATILKQLSMQLSPLPQALLDFYELHRRAGFPPSPAEVAQIISKLSSDFEACFIIVDALDESPGEQRTDLLKVLAKLQMSATRIFVTSRPHETDINIALEHASKIEARSAEEDIQAYLSEKLDDSPRLSRLIDEHLRHQMIAEISERAQGMFLLAVLQLQLVLNQVTKSGVRKVLRGISTELDQLFGDTLVRIERHNPELREIALSTLMWLSCARRPLSTCELQHAVAIRIDEAQIDPDEDCPPLEVIVESCLGLVTIEHDEATVRLCHYSLQEYLERQRDSLFPQAQTTISGVCLTYLSYELPEVALTGRRTKREGIPVQVILEHLPFLQYAVEHWGYHAKEAPFHAIKELALKFAMDFHKTIRAARILVRHAPSLEHRYRFEYCRAGGDEARPEDLEEKLRKFACGLHFAARLDWPELLECLLEKDSKVNGTDMFDNNNTALHIVASRGNLQCVNLVLNREAKVDRYNLGFYTPLFLAASGGHTQVAHALIKRKASVNLKGADGWTALHKAVDLGHVDMVRLLLSHGAWIAAKTARELCPLHRACGRGHYEVMRLLLDHGAPVEATTEDGWTALHGAARSGRKEVVEILLQHSSDLNCQTTEGRTPLHHACRGGHDEIVLLLMAHGADPLVKDRHGQYPVHRAAKGDNPRVLEILLSSGLDQLSERDNFNATPLDVAQSTGSFAAADFLRHAMSSELGLEDTKAALELAIEGGDAELIKVLLDEGADPNSMGPRVWTALEQALQHDREEIATLLLQAGADVDTIGTRGWRALHVAARKGNANTVKLCLDHGADIKSVTEGQQTALHLACYSGDEATIRQLIDRGSDIEATDGRLTRPGHIAASNGHGGALRLLVEKGISLEARAGKSRRTIQSCAAQGSHFALVEFLRERRLNSSEVNDYY